MTHYAIDWAMFTKLPEREQEELAQELAKLSDVAENNPLWFFFPHDKQHLFFAAQTRFKWFLGGNRSGKTTACTVDDLIQAVDEKALPDHLKKYKKWEPPFHWRVVGPDFDHVYNILIPAFQEWCPKHQLRGDSWDSAYDKRYNTLHFKNGSQAQFKTYEQDPFRHGGAKFHRVRFDEEPPRAIYQENTYRLIDYGGDVLIAMTPVQGLCVDLETECLTKRGWLRHDQLTEDDILLSYNISEGVTEWTPLLGVYRDLGYRGPMVQTVGHLDARFTPHHKWVTAERGLVPFDEMTTHEDVVVSAPHRNLNAAFFTEDLLELAGWVIGDGSVRKAENKIVIYQSATANADRCEQIANLIERVGAQHHVRDVPYGTTKVGLGRRFIITGDVARQLRALIGYPKTLRPELVSMLDARGAQALLRGLMESDGMVRPTGTWEYTTTDRGFADAVAMLGILVGRRTSVRPFWAKGKVCYKVRGFVTRPTLTTFKRRTEGCEGNGIWCPSTKNGTFIARRNGTAYVTGNTWMYEEFWKPWDKGKLSDAFVQLVDMDDNPHLDAQGKAAALAASSKEEREARKTGKFVHFHGLVYPDYEQAVVPEQDLPEGVPVYVGIDPGIRHPCAVVFVYHTPDDVLVVFDELLLKDMSVREVCEQIQFVLSKHEIQPAWYVIDPSARNKQHVTGRSLQQEYADQGVVAFAGQNDVRAGINNVKVRMEHAKLVIQSNCTRTVEQFRQYRWIKPHRTGDNEPKEAPVKKEDDLLDALRYLCMARPYRPDREFEPEFVSPLLEAAYQDMKPGQRALPAMVY